MRHNARDLKTLNDLYLVLKEKQDTVLRDREKIMKKEGCSSDYITGFANGLQYAKIMISCTEGFKLI